MRLWTYMGYEVRVGLDAVADGSDFGQDSLEKDALTRTA